jgi:hypothetical protein
VEGVTTLGPTNMNKIEAALGLTSPAYGTSLPGSPVDGQEAILVDSTTNPVYQWRFRWNASNSTSYKWEFVGGTPYIAQDSSGPTISTGTWTLGPSLTAPRSGIYVVSCTSRIYQSPGDTSHRSYIGVLVAGTMQAQIDKGTADTGPLVITWEVTVTSGQLISHGSNADTGTTVIPSNRVVEIYPTRVS